MVSSSKKTTQNKDPMKLTLEKDASGTWYSAQLMASIATTEEKKNNFVSYMTMLSNHFFCLTCREHIKRYIDANPFNVYWNVKNEDGREIGMFKWIWIFHEAVNKRIGKKGISWESAVEMYISEAGICSADCGQDIDNDDVTPIDVPFITPSIVHVNKSKTIDNKKYEYISVSPIGYKKGSVSQRMQFNITSL